MKAVDHDEHNSSGNVDNYFRVSNDHEDDDDDDHDHDNNDDNIMVRCGKCDFESESKIDFLTHIGHYHSSGSHLKC